MVFSEKSVIGLVLGLSVATNLAAGFVPNRAFSPSSSLKSFADEEWFYEEKKTLYSDEATEKGKRKYTKRVGSRTQVFHDNYPLSPNKPPAQPSPYLPVAISSDQQWYQQESTLSYDATMRQRIGPSKPKAKASQESVTMASDDQGMRAPMPAVEPTNSTATSESPYQPAAYSTKTTKTATATIPVANTVEPKPTKPKPTKPLVKLVELRPEDIVTTEGRWFNTEAKVSYGNQSLSRKYKSVKVELREESTEQTQSPFVPVSDTTVSSSAKRSSMDIATTLPLKTREENTSASASGGGKEMATQPEPTREEETPEAAAARLAAIAASTIKTDNRWFNTEKRDFFRPAQQHTPYTISNPEYHMSPSTARAVEEAAAAPSSAGAFVSVSYNPTPAVPISSSNPEAPEAPAAPAAPVPETPAASTARFEPQVAAELIPLTATTDQQWFNSESKGTHYSGEKNVRQHVPYTIRNPEYHRSPNMMRAEQEEAAASPSAGAFVSVSWNPPPAPAAPAAATTTESKSETTAPAEAAPAESTNPVPTSSVTTTTDSKWFNAESKGTYASGVNDVRQHKPYQLIPKGSDEASIRTGS